MIHPTDIFSELFESVLDDIDASRTGTSASKLADENGISPDEQFNQSGTKRYLICFPQRTNNGAFNDAKDKIVRLYESFLEIMTHQHFTKDYVVRVIFYYNKTDKYASYCESSEDFKKTVNAIGAELHGDIFTNVTINYQCEFNPVQNCPRNVFLRDWLMFKKGLYSRITGLTRVKAYAAYASMSNKIDIDMTSEKVPPYLPIMDFYCWLFGDKGGKQKTEYEYKKKFKRVCNEKLGILNILDWFDEHPDAMKDWYLEVVGYITPSGASRERVFVVRLYDKTKDIQPFDAYFDFVKKNILGRMSTEDIHSIFGEGAAPMYQDTLKIYVELPYAETFDKYAAGMKMDDFKRTLTVKGKTVHSVEVQLLRLGHEDPPIPHVIASDGKMLGCPFDRNTYDFLRVRFENVFRKDRG